MVEFFTKSLVTIEISGNAALFKAADHDTVFHLWISLTFVLSPCIRKQTNWIETLFHFTKSQLFKRIFSNHQIDEIYVKGRVFIVKQSPHW